jgi:3-oxoacyl-[acyl-carrier protein] reductase
MELGIDGRRAAVAGASSGLGLATARALAADGGGRGFEAVGIASTDHHAHTLGGEVVAITGDVSTPDGATTWATAASEVFGGIDIAITNAGGPPPGTFASTALEAYPAALDLSLLSVVAMCKVFVPPMQRAGWGRVIAITSVSVRQPLPYLILSNTARAGATGFLKTLALEVAPDGVTVNSVLPASHLTDRIRALHGDDLTKATEGIPVGELGRPEDFGAVVAFLCSDHARFITGSAIPVDGGSIRGLL